MSTGVDCICSIFNLSNIAVSGESKNLKGGDDTMVLCNLCGVQVSLKKLRQHKNLKCQACGHHHLHHGTVAEPRKSNPKLVMRTKKIFVGGLSVGCFIIALFQKKNKGIAVRTPPGCI